MQKKLHHMLRAPKYPTQSSAKNVYSQSNFTPENNIEGGGKNNEHFPYEKRILKAPKSLLWNVDSNEQRLVLYLPNLFFCFKTSYCIPTSPKLEIAIQLIV